MARSLLLGGAGFLGYHLARRLLASPGARVTLVDDFSRGEKDADLTALLRQGPVDLVEADLSQAGALTGLSRDWDAIYMLAAVLGVRHSMADPAGVLRVNTRSILNVLEWAEPGRGALFFASTSEVYAGGVNTKSAPIPTPETVPVSIDRIENPRYAYAVSKILGEAAVIHMGAAKRLPFVIGRFHNVYGDRMGADHVVPELCLRAMNRDDPFRVFGPEQSRAFCHVDDAVDAVVRLVASERARGRIVNIGNDAEEIAIGDLATMVLEVARHRPRLDEVPAPEGSVARRCPDITLVRELTGFSPRVPLEEGVRRTYAWYRARRDRFAQGRPA